MSPRKKKSRRAAKPKTPIRLSLMPASSLIDKVCNGVQALESAHHRYLATDVRTDFTDSLHLDKGVLEDHEQENRWDYLLGHTKSAAVVGLEPHSAKHGEISTVIDKKKAARVQLRKHLKAGKGVARWLWVASGKVYFADTEKARRRLDEHGIQFVGRQLLRKHLRDLNAGGQVGHR